MGFKIFLLSCLGVLCMSTVFFGYWIIATVGAIFYMSSWILILFSREQRAKENPPTIA